MEFDLTKVEMRPDEHVYMMEYDDKAITYHDRGELGVFEPGIDVIEMGRHMDSSAPDRTCEMDPVDELFVDVYRDEIVERVRWAKGEIKNIINGMHKEAEERLRVEYESWWGGKYNTYIELNFGQWCGRTGPRKPYSGHLIVQEYPRENFGQFFSFTSSDFNRDNRTDSISFSTTYPNLEILSVDIKSYTRGPKMWTGYRDGMSNCIDVDLSRRGLEQYLGVMDDIYARAVTEL